MFLDKLVSLTPLTRRIMCEQATEPPHTPPSCNTVESDGSYLCRRCGLALFRAESQFESGCGWPSFDSAISQTVKEVPEPIDEHRIEIRCNRCDGHLGHVFDGEHYTEKNRRYCVNSASIDFVENNQVLDSEETIVAGGCFWGVDYQMRQHPGVLKVEVGYTGGEILSPTYEQVCSGRTGHYEAARVIFDPSKTNYQAVLKHFFAIHDSTQKTGQGVDIGPQYQSALFYYNQEQLTDAEAFIQQLKAKGYAVATQLLSAQPFWAAENYHQNYHAKQRGC
jgi:peptide methionine sulfoxide reductase msrA/msrB